MRALPLFLLVLLIALPAGAAEQIAVSFQQRAEVSGPRIVLADIAKIWPAGSEAEAIGVGSKAANVSASCRWPLRPRPGQARSCPRWR